MIEQLTLEDQEKIQSAADRYSNFNSGDKSSLAYLMSSTARNGFIGGIEWLLTNKEKLNIK